MPAKSQWANVADYAVVCLSMLISRIIAPHAIRDHLTAEAQRRSVLRTYAPESVPSLWGIGSRHKHHVRRVFTGIAARPQAQGCTGRYRSQQRCGALYDLQTKSSCRTADCRCARLGAEGLAALLPEAIMILYFRMPRDDRCAVPILYAQNCIRGCAARYSVR